jgi:glycolate oxidase iron-sulfur subunit
VTHHQGEQAQTRALATALLESFEAEPLDAVLVAASGCGHTLKHYGEILKDSSAQAGRAAAFAGQVQDVQAFLYRFGLSETFRAALKPLPHADGRPASPERPLRLAYHDACHMLHGQGIQAEPRALLRQIPHIELKEASEAGLCCGSAGIYNLVQPQEAAELGRLRAEDLAGTGADLAVSANIGCSLQIRRHMADLPEPITVLHPMQLLDRSFRGADG